MHAPAESVSAICSRSAVKTRPTGGSGYASISATCWPASWFWSSWQSVPQASPMAWEGRSPTASCRPLRPTKSSSASRSRHDLARRPDCLCAPGDGLDGRLVGRSRGWPGRWARRLRRRTDPRISRRPGAIGGTTDEGPGHQRGSFPAPGQAGRQRPTNYSGASPCPGRNRC